MTPVIFLFTDSMLLNDMVHIILISPLLFLPRLFRFIESSRFEHISKQDFASRCSRFFQECNGNQIQLCPAKFTELATVYAAVLVDTDALGAVLPLYTAVVKLRPSPEHLTGVHAELLKVCLKSQCYHIARRILDDDIAYIEDVSLASTDWCILFSRIELVSRQNFENVLAFFRFDLLVAV